MVLFAHTEGRLTPVRLRSRQVWLAWGLVPAIFFLVFAVTNPFAVLHPGGFVETLQAEKEILAFGILGPSL